MTTIETRYIYIDSDKIEQKVGNDSVYVDIPMDIMTADETQQEYIDVELISFNCRNDFYQLVDTNNKFGIRLNGTTTVYSLKEGFPSVLSIDNELKEDLEASTGEIWNVTYSNYTGKITLQSTFSGAVPSDIALDFDVDNSVYRLLGFDKSVYEFNIDGSNVSLTAPHTVNLGARIKALNVRCDLLEDNYEGDKTGLTTSDILAVIPVDVSPLNYLTFSPGSDTFKSHISSHKVTNFNIRITDEDNNLVGLNSGFQVSLRLRLVRESSDESSDYLKQLLDIKQLNFIKNNPP